MSKTKSKTNLQTDQDLPVIAAYWVGPYLSWIEQMGLLSLAVFFHKTLLYSQLGDDFKNVPEQSWLGRKAAELGIDPAAAPLIKTRRQNDLYAKAYLSRLMR